MLSLLWFSCISQNRPAAPPNSALSAVISACGCTSVRGKNYGKRTACVPENAIELDRRQDMPARNAGIHNRRIQQA
jgi:hypothetical protein